MNDFRYEVKFVLDEVRLANFFSWMFVHTRCRKRYSNRVVNSIYLDDAEFSAIKDNLSGLPNRLKSRLRWYQEKTEVEAPEFVLEEKIRWGRLGKKNVVRLGAIKGNIETMPIAEVMDFLRYKLPFEHDLSLRHFSPALFVSYSRQYFEDTFGLRITIDDKITFRSNFLTNRSLEKHRSVQYQSKIAELKFHPRLKNTVKDIIRPLKVSPVRHSKYLTGMAMFGRVNYL